MTCLIKSTQSAIMAAWRAIESERPAAKIMSQDRDEDIASEGEDKLAQIDRVTGDLEEAHKSLSRWLDDEPSVAVADKIIVTVSQLDEIGMSRQLGAGTIKAEAARACQTEDAL